MVARSTPLVRGAPVVEAIYGATFEELARVGFAGLSREEVAARANVNKSTVYRRWPTVADLVIAAFGSVKSELVTNAPNTGSLRGDLRDFILALGRLVRTPLGRAGARLFLFEQKVAPELRPLLEVLREENDARGPGLIVDRAIGRGELPANVNRDVLLDTVRGAVIHRVLRAQKPVDAAYVDGLLDLLLHGVLARQRRAR